MNRKANYKITQEDFDVAKRLSTSVCRRFPSRDRDHIESAIFLGLVEASYNYIPDKGEFIPFAYYRMKGAAIDAVRNIYGRYKKKPEFLPFKDGTIEIEGGRFDLSFDAVESLSEEIASKDMVAKILAAMPSWAVDILILRCCKGLTNVEIGKVYRVTDSRISQLYNKALRLAREIAVNENIS